MYPWEIKNKQGQTWKDGICIKRKWWRSAYYRFEHWPKNGGGRWYEYGFNDLRKEGRAVDIGVLFFNDWILYRGKRK